MGQSDKKQEDFWFTLLRREDERALWHPELELLFVLKGAGPDCSGVHHRSPACPSDTGRSGSLPYDSKAPG